MEFSGRLATIQFGDVLQLAHQERWSGGLVVRRSSREKRVFLRDGKVAGCISDDPAEFYGRHLLLHGHLAEADLSRALSWCTDRSERLGTALRELNILPEETIRRTLADRIADAICDLFLWRRGVFYLETDEPPHEEIRADALDTYGLVMEGSRWVDEYARIRKVLVNDQVVLRRGPRWPPHSDSPAMMLHLTRAVDGERTLADLHQALGGSWFRCLEAAYSLCLAEVLDIERVGTADTTVTGELSLLDILMEQAATEESTILSERHFSIPVDLLVQLVPAWTDRPGDDEIHQQQAPVARFLAGIDGRRPIRDLLSTATDARGRQLEQLLVELRKGRLALLPGGVDDVVLQR